MEQQSLQLPVSPVVDVLLDSQSDIVMARHWKQATRSVEVSAPPEPPQHQPEPVKKTVRTRFTYD